MGIPGLERELRNSKCVVEVSIPDLMKKSGRNVIVIDGFQFYGLYIYPKFDWVCGALKELVEEIRKFVKTFERAGVKLVFFFVEGHLDEGADSCGSRSWVKRHSTFVEYTKRFYSELSRRKNVPRSLNYERDYYHTPFHAQSVVLFVLQHILHCEVHLVYAGDRCDATAYYTRNNNCLALLARDNYYMFYQGVLHYLSLTDLNLEDMTTIKYCPDVFAKQKGLEGTLYPVFINSSCDLEPTHKEMLIQICKILDNYSSKDVARGKIMECIKRKRIDDILGLDGKDAEEMSVLTWPHLLINILRYNVGFENKTVHGPVKKWELIKVKAQELYQSGLMSIRIEQILISKKYYNDSILEDFTELPPSTLIYRPLREKLYGVLFHEEPHDNTKSEVSENRSQDQSADFSDSDDDVPNAGVRSVWQKKMYDSFDDDADKPHKDNGIYEWAMSINGCFKDIVPVAPAVVDPALHPGLLSLWDRNNDIQDIKWHLFTASFSTMLDCKNLRALPPTLIVPTTVLYYLYNNVPNTFKTGKWKYLQPWEVEVFIAQAVMLPKKNLDVLSKTIIQNVNSRVVNLIAIFVYGCHTMRLLVEACGHPISERDLSLSHYFDGKLLHSFYDRAEWRRSAVHLCDRESLALFQQIKQIILPES